jgi:tryptophan-rich sensory protein
METQGEDPPEPPLFRIVVWILVFVCQSVHRMLLYQKVPVQRLQIPRH